MPEETLPIVNTQFMEMLSFITHELKSPLDSIITLGKTLTDGYYGTIEDEQKSIVDRMVKKAEYLAAISAGLLHLALFESGKLKPNPDLVDLFDGVILPAIEIIVPQIEENQMDFRQDIRENIYPAVCDANLIKIVIVNFLSNAVKYGKKKGRIWISMKNAYKKYIISVWNEGRGFTKSEKEMLFQKFSRIQAPELLRKKGTGVGLYVSWQIINLHGGTVTAESDPGSWAEFTIQLPKYPEIS